MRHTYGYKHSFEEGKLMEVNCYTNAAKVELFLNGRSLGRKAVENMVRPLLRSQTDFTRDPAALASLRSRISAGVEANAVCGSAME